MKFPRELCCDAVLGWWPCVQPCRFATGIDTGCVLGDQLTAVVLPSLAEMRERGLPSPPQGAVTLDSIGARLESVRAKEVYRRDDDGD